MVGENGSHWAILEIAEQAAPGNTITLWPRIATQAAKISRKTVGPNLFKERFRLAVELGLLLLLVGSLIFVPAVRAITESIFQRLGIAFVDTEQFGPKHRDGASQHNHCHSASHADNTGISGTHHLPAIDPHMAA